ncbi:uncharacterized protein LOC127439066 [Myxocyprinus asiaticus]|uniref:uncharacterized protein LOC127439066 n=1 Tax=Myxocyprinus asiaticus TaxID=70543 RepID=UPI002221BD7A|nr:uncharacterized protein LOC127439066 [Myxocyprinus asiaticus]XP_051551062.1 uncharacterized protein LOC127439066 [Myxocyprinus asiaticus]
MLNHFNQGNNSRIIQFLIYLLIWCPAAETLTDQLTDLEQNVIINCDLNENEVYWVLSKLQGPPVIILRSFSTSTTPYYYNKRFRHKYSMRSKHLFISNVTIDELGVYYCMNTEIPPKFSDGTKLHVIEQTQQTECQNYTVLQYIQQNQTEVSYIQQNQTQWQIITVISCLLNGVLIIGTLSCYSGESSKLQSTDLQLTQAMVLQPSQELSKELYTEVVFSTLCEGFGNS